MQAQQDVIRGFMTLGTGNRRVELLGRFMFAAGRGFINGGINLPRNLRDGILGVMNLTYDLAMERDKTVNRLKEKVTDIAVKAVEIASDPHGTYEKAMDSLTAMGEDGLLSAAGEITGGIAFDVWSGGLTKGMGGKALAMAQETKVGRAIAKGYEEARGAVQSAKTAISGIEKNALRTRTFKQVEELVSRGGINASHESLEILNKLRKSGGRLQVGENFSMSLLSELQRVSQVEYALVRKKAEYYLLRGKPFEVGIPSWVDEVMAHSHPGSNIFSLRPSFDDVETVFGKLQTNSIIVNEVGIAVEFTFEKGAKPNQWKRKIRKIWKVD